MTSDNPTADRLLNDARKKTAAQERPLLAQIGMALGAIGIVSGPLVPGAGWGLGLIAAVLGGVSLQRPAVAKLAKIALVLGIGAILVATFRFSLYMAH
jgi:hypothetical protein